MKLECGTFIAELIEKQHDIADVMEEIYASIATKRNEEEINSDFVLVWESLIAYGFISYYYYLLFGQLEAIQDLGKITDEQKIDTMDQFEQLVDLEKVVLWLSPKIGIFSQWRPVDKMITSVNHMIADYKVVTLFQNTDPAKLREARALKDKQKSDNQQDSETKDESETQETSTEQEGLVKK